MNKCEEAGFQHLWKETPHLTLEYRPDGLYDKHRKCANCGKEQVMQQKPSEWNDVNVATGEGGNK